jgi:opacity protein-like surface antigen
MRTYTLIALFITSLAAPASAQAPVSRPASTSTIGVYITANGGFQPTKNDFDDGATLRVNAENGRFDIDYTVKSGPAFDIGGGITLWRRLGLGVAWSQFSNDTPATLTASIPHPFFFSTPRTLTASLDGLRRKEQAVHVEVRGIAPVGKRLQVSVFGGPSFFDVTQDVVDAFTYDETYPFDTVSFRSATTRSEKVSKVGFNVGGDVSVFVTRILGVGASARFATTTVSMTGANGNAVDVKAGGLQVGGGLRLRF